MDIEKKDECGCSITESQYPYGTKLFLDTEMVEGLGLKDCKTGEVYTVYGYAFIDNISEYSNEKESRKDVCLQLTTLEVEKVKESKDRATLLYGE